MSTPDAFSMTVTQAVGYISCTATVTVALWLTTATTLPCAVAPCAVIYMHTLHHLHTLCHLALYYAACLTVQT
jgi:hypothetical protein